ncbi:serine/arginine repetitive matrix protein 1-like [Panicum miliaceum]|uniref:Serine/arginine repetitive matrix protein 1-like n=1 Tax=Panicum miliaceum TaxID=4540 RepID=A0A3L6S9M4_PANMI|nr:serine/arginine repetitive matrix protein 1-like [Panicum miliaceum]
MDGKVASNVELDSAVFQVSSPDNRYEAIACSKGNTELIASGPFDQLVLHLEDAKKFQSRSSSGTFKLLLAGDGKGSSWFTKSTIQRFLHIINSSDTSKSVNGVLDEMSQLEETRKFHQSLYIKEQQNVTSGALTGGLFGTGAIAQQGNVGPNSSETTKNELLRAVDLRLTALKEEILVLLNQAVGSNLSTREISDLSAFVQRFGTSEFSWLMRCMLLIAECQPSELPVQQDSTAEKIDKGENAHKTRDIIPRTNLQRPIANNVSPAKLAQIERESSTETDDSSESSDEGEAVVERSRPLVRSASPRRSASPMRRVQIGRSGSRRSTAIAIKSLSYFPPSQRIPLDKDDESSNCNGETDQPPRKSDNNVRRMSVQDAINLFESKQKDQNPDSQNKKAGLFATKSVLRRWSAGMGDSLNDKSEERISDSTSESKSNNMSYEEKDGPEPDKAPKNFVTSEVEGLTSHADSHDIRVSETENVVSNNICAEQTKSGPEESSDRAMASAEWNRQKEAELNQMLLKMMEVLPGKFAGANATAAGLDSTNQKKGVTQGQHKEKRDTKITAEKGKRRPIKEASSKPLKDTVGPKKSALTPKTGTVTEKHISPVPQKARRNSSPPVLPKEVASKTPVRKSSPKPSPSPAPAPTTRSSWSGGSLTKATTTQKPKSSPGMASTSTPTSRRRIPTTHPSSQPASKVERTIQPVKNKKETVSATKPAIKGQEEKKPKTATKTSRITKVSPSSEEKSSVTMKESLHKVSKKSSVVPLESKPLKKATGISQSVGSGTVKKKVPQLDDSSKDSGSVNQAEDKEQSPLTTEPTTKVLEADLAQPAHDVDENLEISLDNDLNIEKTEKPASSLTATEMGSSDQVEPSTNDADEAIQTPDEDMGISSAAWVEVEHEEQEVTDPSENVVAEDVTSPGIAPLPSSSPRVRHSLSQMLQADSNEPEIIEWGNAENPPAIVFQKDSPKGFKRLLKFARKNKGDNNANGWASPSVVSEGEDELEESRGTSDGANSSRRTFDGSKTSSILSAQSTIGSFNSINSDKQRERPGAAPSTKVVTS